jgi:hypothetical protein
LLAEGRIETLERWLEECGEMAGEHPDALLVRAELLSRQGELGQAATLAESVARSLPPDHRLASRANHIAGQALYLRSRSDLAAPFYAKALNGASTDLDRRNALWGAFLAQVDLDIESSTALLADLESTAPPDLNTPCDRRSPDGRVGTRLVGRRLVGSACTRTTRSTCHGPTRPKQLSRPELLCRVCAIRL